MARIYNALRAGGVRSCHKIFTRALAKLNYNQVLFFYVNFMFVWERLVNSVLRFCAQISIARYRLALKLFQMLPLIKLWFLEHGVKIISGTQQFNGYGRVHVQCSGKGDSSMWIYWNRTDKCGNHVLLNASKNQLSNSEWLSVLLDKPNRSKFPYVYQCIVESKCCTTLRSPPLKITYFPTPNSKNF